ncbi:MAG TPA: hypothetical protein VN873_02565 [Candidatus Angelobacter sp.]|nr:hypothetical protein [Candidatus Angelobacter sp.]
MEVYFKELISKETSLEKIVDDLERVVQGVDDLAKSIGVNDEEAPRSKIHDRLRRLKANCERLKAQIVARAQATDRLVRRNPYPFVAGAMLLGLFAGAKRRGRDIELSR